MVPDGVATVQPDDERVEAAVAGARLAARPGRREAADAGELEGLREVARASARARRAAPPPPGRAGRARGRRSSTPRRRRGCPSCGTRSRDRTPAKPERRATRPPVTDVPPPNGTTATWWRDRELEQRDHVVVGARADHRVGGVGQVAGAGAEQVGGRLAAGAQPTGLVVGQDVLVAEQRAQRRPAPPRAATTRAARRSTTAGDSWIPKASSTSPRVDSGSGAAAAGSPQREGCISGSCVTL